MKIFFTTLKIYLLSNIILGLLVFIIVCVYDNVFTGYWAPAAALTNGLVYGLPVLILLNVIFFLIKYWEISLDNAWLVLLFSIVFLSILPAVLFDLYTGENRMAVLWSLGLACGYLSVVILCRTIHDLFQSFQNESNETN